MDALVTDDQKPAARKVDDRQLVEAALANRPGAFAALVRQHEKLVWHLVYRMVSHPEDTRELSQEVFLQVYRKLGQFRFESALATWIGRIAFSLAARHVKRNKLPLAEPMREDEEQVSPTERVPDDFDLAAACEDANLIARVQAAMEELEPLPRSILGMYYQQDLGVAEIAEITALPAGTIKSHLYRTRLRLREVLLAEEESNDE